MKRSWTPKRRGAIYCSSACGHGCTWAAYIQAVQEASYLATVLNRKGAGWKPRVWENLGWYYEAYSGNVHVYDGFCLISDSAEHPSGGSMLWTTSDNPYRDDPVKTLMHEFDSMLTRAGDFISALRLAGRAAGREADVEKLLRGK